MLTERLAPIPSKVVGRVMKAAEALKKLPKSEAAAVQRQVFRDAASLKTVVQVRIVTRAHTGWDR